MPGPNIPSSSATSPSATTSSPTTTPSPTPLPADGPRPQNKPDKVKPKPESKPKPNKEALNKQLEEMLTNMIKALLQQQDPNDPSIEGKARAQAKSMVPSSANDNNSFEETSSDSASPSIVPQQDHTLENQLEDVANKIKQMFETVKDDPNVGTSYKLGLDSLASTVKELKDNLATVKNDPSATNQYNLSASLRELGKHPMLKEINSDNSSLERIGENLAQVGDQAISQKNLPTLNFGGKASG